MLLGRNVEWAETFVWQNNRWKNIAFCQAWLRPILQAEEEVRELQKKMQQLENDLDQTQEKLMNANQRLEEKEKALQNVSRHFPTSLM